MRIKINILYVKTKRDAEEVKNIEDVLKEREYLDQAGVEFNEIAITAESNSSDEATEILLTALNNAQPDILITGAGIFKYSFFNDRQLINMLYQLNCPVIIGRHFAIPGVHKLKSMIQRLIRNSLSNFTTEQD
jgi:basic amino acid/polyamine antiporter, APA family